MTSNTFNQSKFIPTPPEKGSFPLDHESLCKKYYLLYMRCLRRSDDQSSECRKEAQDYLGCRMKNQLMEEVEWSKLGFEDRTKEQQQKQPPNTACTGSVATIKLLVLIEKLQTLESEYNFNIKVIVTKHAKHFVDTISSPLPNDIEVLDDDCEWSSWTQRGDPVVHIDLGKWADIMVIAPLSANSLAKMAVGLCDNLLMCVVRAWDFNKLLLFCPAMNTRMYDHPLTSEHIAKLKSWGYHEVPTISKTLMCGDTGNGAMAEVDTIIEHILCKLRACK